MKKQKTLRIPRKLKKQFKKLWILLPPYIGKKPKDIVIIKSSVAYDVWPKSPIKEVWGCMTRPR